MRIVELDPSIALAAVEGYQNELETDALKLEALYRQVRCPRCGEVGQKEFSARHAFADPNLLTPRALLRCIKCRCLFNPHVLDKNGEPMIVHRGDPGIHL